MNPLFSCLLSASRRRLPLPCLVTPFPAIYALSCHCYRDRVTSRRYLFAIVSPALVPLHPVIRPLPCHRDDVTSLRYLIATVTPTPVIRSVSYYPLRIAVNCRQHRYTNTQLTAVLSLPRPFVLLRCVSRARPRSAGLC